MLVNNPNDTAYNIYIYIYADHYDADIIHQGVSSFRMVPRLLPEVSASDVSNDEHRLRVTHTHSTHHAYQVLSHVTRIFRGKSKSKPVIKTRFYCEIDQIGR